MTSDEKNAVSHRARALREFSEFVKNGMQRKKIKD
jgi:inosine/xanthosine triphosphate pyrophosphatase family protein